MTTSRFIFAAVSSVGFSPSALASDCNTIVAQLVAGVPGLSFTSASHMAGAPNYDVAYLKHPQASQIALSCSPREPSLSIDWRGGSAPAGYFELIGLLGSILTGVPVDAIRSGSAECQRLAGAAAYEMSGIALAGVRFECAIFTHEGGGMTMTIHRITR
jgi:hypothetical protein